MKKGLIVVVVIVLVAVPVFSQFYKNMSNDERQRLAEAYYLVGLQYKEVGKAEKGEDYIRAAKRIYPQLEPEKIDPAIVRRDPAIKIYGEWEPTFAAIPKGKAAYNAVIYRFSEFLRGFYLERTDILWHVLDDRVYAPLIPTGVPLDTAMEEVRVFFNNLPISETPPSDMFELDSISAQSVTRNVWQATIDLAEQDPFDLARYLNPGEKTQNFYFRNEEGNWVLFAAGFLPDNIEHIISPRESIRQTLTACLKALVSEDARKASSYFADPTRIIPSGRSMRRSALRKLFEDYFEEVDLSRFVSLQVSLDVEEAPDMDLGPGASYRAFIDFPAAIEEELPFWDRYQGFYFTYDRDEKGWRIAAIF